METMSTYTKTFIICPHCGAHTNSSVDHLDCGQSFGPWYCDKCGGGYCGNANGTTTEVRMVADTFKKTLDLLVLNPHDKPIYFVMKGRHYQPKTDIDNEKKRFFYEQHSCPTNWIINTILISVDGDTDPHGFMKFVRSVPHPAIPDNKDIEDEIKAICAEFPELKAL